MIESTMFAALSPLFSGRVFPDVAPTGTAKPYAVYQQVGGQVVDFLEGGAAIKRNARVQINVWAGTRVEANTLMRQVEDALQSSPYFAQTLGALVSRYDEDAECRGAQQDFSLWWS